MLAAIRRAMKPPLREFPCCKTLRCCRSPRAADARDYSGRHFGRCVYADRSRGRGRHVGVVSERLLPVSCRCGQFRGVLVKTASTTGSIMLIVAAAGLFGWVIAREQGPQMVTEAMLSLTDNPYVFLLLINVVLLLTGNASRTRGGAVDHGSRVAASCCGIRY